MAKQEMNTVREKDRLNQISKLVILCIVCCILVGVMLSLYQNTITAKITEYEEKGKMEHTVWLIKYGSLLPPVIIIAIVITAAYSFGSPYIPVRTQKDKAIIVGITFAFTYLVLFTSTLISSPGWNLPTPETEEEIKTAFEICAPWFFAQIIPFMLVLSYHLVRASSEKKELEENEG